MVIRPTGLVAAQLREASIGEEYWSVSFERYAGPLEAKALVLQYLLHLDKHKEKGIGILFAGPHGVGKTTLAMIAMKYLVRANWTVFTTSLGEIIETTQRGWKTGEGGESFIDECRRAEFLLIDDVGKEHRGQSGFVQTVFDNLIRYRVQHCLPTFITTNHTKKELSNIYGDGALSLLEGKLIPIIVNGQDYRRTELKYETRATI